MGVFDGPIGKRTLERLVSERIIWLTTVTSSGRPQPRPVWFVWDGESVLIYTEHSSWKVAHIEMNPQVSLHFNSDEYGGDIQVLLGDARRDRAAPVVRDNSAYISKYVEGIRGINMEVESYSQRFDTPLRIHVSRIRGLDPLT